MEFQSVFFLINTCSLYSQAGTHSIINNLGFGNDFKAGMLHRHGRPYNINK